MQVKTLYCYEREKGKTTVSTEKPEKVEFTTLIRLVASEGKALTKDNKIFHSCIDVENQEGWYEVDYHEETEHKHMEGHEYDV